GGALVAAWAHRLLRGRLRGARLAIAVGAVYAVYALLLYGLMPPNPDPVELPADLVQRFRLLSIVGIAGFWIVLGLLCGQFLEFFDRRARRRPRPGDQPTSLRGSSAPGDPPQLEFHRVACAYGPEVVLDGVTLRIEPGQFVGLVGPS